MKNSKVKVIFVRDIDDLESSTNKALQELGNVEVYDIQTTKDISGFIVTIIYSNNNSSNNVSNNLSNNFSNNSPNNFSDNFSSDNLHITGSEYMTDDSMLADFNAIIEDGEEGPFPTVIYP